MKTRIKKPRLFSLRKFSIKRLSLPEIEPKEWAFFLSYSIILLYMIFSVSFFLIHIQSFWKPMFLLCMALLVASELIQNGMTWKNLLQIGIIAILFVNLMRIAGGMSQNSIAGLMVYMYCARKISFRKIAKVTLILSGVALAIIVGSAYSGIIQNYISDDSRKRVYLGFLYALNGPTIMSNITLLWIYLKKEKMTLTGAMVYGLLNFFFYRQTDSRLCFFLTLLMILIGLFLRRRKDFLLKRKMICWGMVFSFAIAALVSYQLTVHYDPSVAWQASLDKALGRRLSLGQESLDQIGVSWFGIEGIQWVGNGLNMYGETSNETYLYVDNYFIQVMQRFGIVFLLIVIAFLTFAAYKSYRKQDAYLLCILVVLAGHFMLDNLYMYLQYNTFWFATGLLVFSRQKQADSAKQRGEENLVKIFAG